MEFNVNSYKKVVPPFTIDIPRKATYTFGGTNNQETVACRDTYRLQLTSLHMFAHALGYEYDTNNKYDGGSFVKMPVPNGKGGFYKTDKKYISTDTMVDWHNTNFQPSMYHAQFIKLHNLAFLLRFDVENMQEAIDSKLVHRVYFQTQGKGRNKQIIVQKHIVEYLK